MTETVAPNVVTPERAALLAAHATVVQGGFSTPENEKARAEKDIAAGAVIDWEKMQAEVVAALLVKMGASTPPTEETEAAALEGLAPMPADLIPLREEKRQLDEQLEVLNNRVSEIKETFGKRLEEAGLQGFLLNGKVHARVSHGTRHTIDSKKLKEQMPHIWERFMRATKYRSIRVD